jgi:hypothetical protein
VAAAAAAAGQQQVDAEEMAATTRLATRSLHHWEEEGVARQRKTPIISKESDTYYGREKLHLSLCLNKITQNTKSKNK